MPADPVLAIVGDRAPQEVYDQVYQEMGLDRPIYEQYWRYLTELAQGDILNRTAGWIEGELESLSSAL